MESELQILNSVKKYLESLGYPTSNIVFGTTYGGLQVDLVVKDTDKVLVVVEVKSKMFDTIKSNDLIGYHPITRGLQKTAIEIGAKYYIISDGKRHTWLVTGETGRPEEIKEIKFKEFASNTLSNSQFTKDILSHVKELIRNFPISGDYIYDMSLIIYSKVLQEKYSLESIPDEVERVVKWEIDNSNQSTSTPLSILKESVSRLSFVDLLENRFAVMEFIDDLLRDVKYGWTIPRWVASLMANLIDLTPDDKIIDIFSQRGLILSAANLHGYKQLTSYYLNNKDFFWIRIQRLLASPKDHDEDSIFKLTNLADIINLNDRAMGVLLAFPFNVKIDYFKASYLGHSGVTEGNILFIEAALRLIREGGKIVAIIPDSVLLSKNQEVARQYFLDESRIESVISLPIETFKPFATVKCSIIVLKKKIDSVSIRTFFGSIARIPKRNFQDLVTEVPIQRLLENIDSTKKNLDFAVSQDNFYVDKLQATNFHYSYYWRVANESNIDELESGYKSIPLKNLIRSVFRGNSIVSDTEGAIPYIGPAALRGLQIINEKLSTTSSFKLPKGTLRKIEQGEILINMIGPYRGAAALVGAEAEGYFINRHVVAIKPDTDRVLPGYLAIAMNSSFVKEQLFDRSTGTVIPSLNLSILENIYLPIPSLAVQGRIYNEYLQNVTELENLRLNGSILQDRINSQLMTLGKVGVEP
jgi:Holliday junction resolvase-like predicted endonuclease